MKLTPEEAVAIVALFTRAWIEICQVIYLPASHESPSLRGRGLKYCHCLHPLNPAIVALFTRAWIEIERDRRILKLRLRRPLYEGVD